MDWDAAIDLNRSALLRLLTVMFAAVGCEVSGSVDVVKQRTRLMVLRLLGPAESALRRIILLRARAMADAEYTPGPKQEKRSKRKGSRSKSVAFPLFDPRKKQRRKGRKHPKGPGPRISFFDGTDPPFSREPQTPKPGLDDAVSAESLCQRLNAFARALGDLDKQAKRLKRAEARRRLSKRLSGQGVLRINTAPGHRKKGRSDDEVEVDAILKECQTLARRWIEKRDTS